MSDRPAPSGGSLSNMLLTPAVNRALSRSLKLTARSNQLEASILSDPFRAHLSARAGLSERSSTWVPLMKRQPRANEALKLVFQVARSRCRHLASGIPHWLP